eukprot:TRINITY_DN67334_c7_g3_i1.p1 TRINITY_DN67334_c7_g3~~TRINITY_DN67334_c7_g3_i1.p1  ORF type:complete len:132 (+),score=15.75 TRINITY_DN67334_c7_g3_i1:219-614(+)
MELKHQQHAATNGEEEFLPTISESVTLFLYTGNSLLTLDGPFVFHHHLNGCLVARKNLEPYGPFLFLFLSALCRLPVFRGTVWRGLSVQVGTDEKYNIEVDDGDGLKRVIMWPTFFCSSTQYLPVGKEEFL